MTPPRPFSIRPLGTPGLQPARPGPHLYDDWLQAELFEQRVVRLAGDLDEVTAGRMATELMMLDAAGDDPIHLQVTSRAGTVDAGLTLLDAIGVVGIEVRATVLGVAEGPACWAVVACHQRSAGPSARLSLTAPEVAGHGSAGDLAAWVERVDAGLARVAAVLAEASHLSVAEVTAALRERRHWTPDEAVEAGLLDEVAHPGASIHHLPRRIGFRPD